MSKSATSLRTNSVISLALLVAFFCTFTLSARAACYLCSNPDACFLWQGSCNEAKDSGFICFTAGALAKQPGTYILSSAKGAWLIEPTKKTPLASDQMVEFRAKLNTKYAKSKSGDPSTAKLIAADWATFFKTPQNMTVCQSNLKAIALETGLAVRSETTSMPK